MRMPPRYLVSDRFDIGILSSLTAAITLTEITLEEVCQRIEESEREMRLGLHGGWADAIVNRDAVTLSPNGPILLVARSEKTDHGAVMKWVQIEVTA